MRHNTRTRWVLSFFVVFVLLAAAWRANAAPQGVPVNVTADPHQKPRSITVKWQLDSSYSYTAQWTVTRSPGPWHVGFVGLDSQVSPDATDWTASPGVIYTYRVCNIDVNGGKGHCATSDPVHIRPDPKAPSWVNALRMSDKQVSIGWARGDEGTDYFQVQSSFASPLSYSNIGGHQPPSAGSYTATLPSGSSGSIAINVRAYTNGNLLYRVCAGNNIGTIVCSDPGVHPRASDVMPSIPH